MSRKREGPQSYKEYQGQNFLEIRYSERDFDQISIDEAWTRYNQNVKLLGKIFTLVEEGEPVPPADELELERNIKELGERLEVFREESKEGAKKKLRDTIAKNMGFHDWMDKHRRPIQSTSDTLVNELDLEELVMLGKEAAIPHPYSVENSPFFRNDTNEMILEVKKVRPQDRPFQDLHAISLVDVRETETKAFN
mgnify:CR=1 FL=1